MHQCEKGTDMKDFPGTSVKSEKVALTGILSVFRDALEEEIEKIEKSGHSSKRVNTKQKSEGMS